MEIPKPPPTLVARLQEHDKSLGIRFNVDEGLWEITETLKSGVVSHCFYWHDGDWRTRKFKQLPLSAEPLLTKLGIIDWSRGGANPKERYERFKAEGRDKRAALMEKANKEFQVRAREYAAWLQRQYPTLRRQHQMGGASRKRAVASRLAALRDLYGGKLAPDPAKIVT